MECANSATCPKLESAARDGYCENYCEALGAQSICMDDGSCMCGGHGGGHVSLQGSGVTT